MTGSRSADAARMLARRRRSSSAYHSPLLNIGLSNCSLSHSIFCYSQAVPPPVMRKSYRYFTWPEGVLHYVYQDMVAPLQNSLILTVVGFMADMASPLLLQRTKMVCYVGDFSSLTDHLVSYLISHSRDDARMTLMWGVC
jgi:hypothetical protein